MGGHIIDGKFQSDKYPTCPAGKVPLSTEDPMAIDLLWEYARRRCEVDLEFSNDLQTVLKQDNPAIDFSKSIKAMKQELRDLRVCVVEWICEKCKMVFPPIRDEMRGVTFRTCQKCHTVLMPKQLHDIRELKAELAGTQIKLDEALAAVVGIEMERSVMTNLRIDGSTKPDKRIGNETLVYSDGFGDCGYVRCPRCMFRHEFTVSEWSLNLHCRSCDHDFELIYNKALHRHFVKDNFFEGERDG